MNETIKSIMERRSCRSFKADPIADDDLGLILKAGQYAASANNHQPWHFTVVTNQALLSRIVEGCRKTMLASGDQVLLDRLKNPDYHTFYHAPAVIIVSGDTQYRFANSDCANAVQNMAVAAHSLGLGSCYNASFLLAFTADETGSLTEALGIPDGYRPFFALAVGYKNAADAQPAPRADNAVNYIR